MTQTEARELAQRFGTRMCDENGDTHGEELYCLGLDDIVEMVKALAQPEQEPVGWTRKVFSYDREFRESQPQPLSPEWQPCFTTPPQRKPLTDEHCTWKQQDDIHMPDTWEADCGAMWTFTEGGPKDNDMHYCPKCGKPAIEAAHGIKE